MSELARVNRTVALLSRAWIMVLKRPTSRGQARSSSSSIWWVCISAAKAAEAVVMSSAS